jgi:hypothetical protein
MAVIVNPNFKGTIFRLPDTWGTFIPVDKFKTIPINYLEIGVLCGANLIKVAQTIAVHPDSRLFAVDPWIEYDEYKEFEGKMDEIYDQFIYNINTFGVAPKVQINRGFSFAEVPRFRDEMFDMIYVDGHHDSEFVLEDAVLAFRKLKPEGYMIFDDYGQQLQDPVKRGVDAFIFGYKYRIKVLGIIDFQLFIQKIIPLPTVPYKTIRPDPAMVVKVPKL